MDIKNEEKKVMELKLRSNMIKYVELKEAIEKLVAEQENIKDENLIMVRGLVLRKVSISHSTIAGYKFNSLRVSRQKG